MTNLIIRLFQEDELVGKFQFANKKVIAVGRNPLNDVFLPDKTNTISRFQCLLIQEGKVLYIQNLSRQNNTKVNGSIRPYTRIQEEDEIQIGPFVLRVEVTKQPIKTKPVKTIKDDLNPKDLVTRIIPEQPGTELENLEKHPGELRLLYRFSSLLHHQKDYEDSLFKISKILLERYSLRRVIVAENLTPGNSFTEIINYPYKKSTISQTVLDLLSEEKEMLIIENIKSDNRFKKAKSIIYSDVNSILITPLVKGKEMIGFFALESSKVDGFASKALVNLVGYFATDLSHFLVQRHEYEALNNFYQELQEDIQADQTFIGISGKNHPVFNLIEKIAKTDTTVLITGETGTGKDIIAKLIHDSSDRHSQPFIQVNCAALPENVLESELFGVIANYPGFHNKEALSGKFLLAQKGTLFLNELGEIPLKLQAKLLTAIENKSIWPLGGKDQIPVDIRIIAATNKDLQKEIKNGNFREDLYERLNLINIKLPPLREKKEDIPILAGYFLHLFRVRYNKRVIGFSKTFLQRLEDYDWPRNIRELKNKIQKAVILTESSTLSPRLLELPRNENEIKSLSQLEQEHILKVLKNFDGNKDKTSRHLGISKQTLYNKLEKYKISN